MAPARDIGKGRRLVIHCGAQKTGSTSLHHFLQRNRDALAPHLVALTPVKGSPLRRLGRAAVRFSLDPAPARRAALADLAGALRDGLAASGDTPVLLSHENLCGAMLGKGGVRTLYPELEGIMEVLDSAFAPMRPEYVFYTRDMADWKSSVYVQAVKSDRYPRTRAEFEAETAGCGTWADLKARMQARAGGERVVFLRAEDEDDPARPGRGLLRHCGLADAVTGALEPLQGRRNTALNAGAVEFLRLANTRDFGGAARRMLVDLVQRNQSLFVGGRAP